MGYCLDLRTLVVGSLLGAGLAVSSYAAPRQMENLTRGLIASNVGSGMLVSWRLLGTDDPTTEFNLYRDGKKIASIGKSARKHLRNLRLVVHLQLRTPRTVDNPTLR